MKRTFLFLVIIMSIMIFGNCGSDSNKEIKDNCNLYCGDRPVVEMDITLKAITTEDAYISRLIYKWAGDTDTIYDPVLPWEKIVDVPAETDFHIEAIGTTLNGTIELSYYGKEIVTEISGSDFCSHEDE